jgi:hypothetical protein
MFVEGLSIRRECDAAPLLASQTHTRLPGETPVHSTGTVRVGSAVKIADSESCPDRREGSGAADFIGEEILSPGPGHESGVADFIGEQGSAGDTLPEAPAARNTRGSPG